MNADEYLKRINSLNFKENSLPNLFRLQQNHLINVPFENLDIHLGRRLECKLDKIYEKVVTNHRGGSCYELNYLFAWLLKELGFLVNIVSCRAYRPKSEYWAPWYGHCALMVNMNESNFLVDVGFCQNFRSPLKFVLNKIQVDLTGHYNIVRDEECGDVYLVLKCSNFNLESVNHWTPVYKFKTEPKKFEDFHEMIDYVQSKDNLRFYNRSLCVIHTTYTILNLVGHRLSEIKFFNSIEKSKTHSVLTKAEVFDAVKNIYGINLDENEQFEPKGEL